MSLVQIQIDGYGHFAAETFHLQPGLNVLHGPNEAGKSTLLRFIRFLLFGRERRRGVACDVALAGGAFGGALVLRTGAGDLRIARGDHGPTVSADGLPSPTSALDALLGGFDREGFDAVFACELDDLAALAALDDQVLRGRLFASSVMGSGVDVKACLARWKSEVSDLGPRKGTGELRRIHTELDQARTDLDAARREAERIPRIVARLAALELELQASNTRRAAARTHLDLLAAIAQAIPAVQAILRAEAWLQSNPRPERSVEQWDEVVSRLRTAQQDLREVQSAEGDLRAQLEVARGQRDEVVVDERLLEQTARLDALHRGAAALADLGSLQLELARARSDLDADLAQLGLADPDALAEMRVEVPTIRRLQKLAEAIPAAPRDPSLLDARARLADAVHARDEVQARLLSTGDPGPAVELRDRLPALEHAAAQVDELGRVLDTRSSEAAELSHRLAELQHGWEGGLAAVDDEALGQAARDHARWQARRVTRESDLQRLADQLAAATAEVTHHAEPILVPTLSARALHWAGARAELERVQRETGRLELEVDAGARALAGDLEGRPWIDTRPALERVRKLAWSDVHSLTDELIRTTRDVRSERPKVGPGEPGTPNDELIGRRDAALALHRRVVSRQATRVVPLLLVGCALAMLASVLVAAWLRSGIASALLGTWLLAAVSALVLYAAWYAIGAVSARRAAADLGLAATPSGLEGLALATEAELAVNGQDLGPANPDLEGRLRAEALERVCGAERRLQAALGDVTRPEELTLPTLLDLSSTMVGRIEALDRQCAHEQQLATQRARTRRWLQEAAAVATELELAPPADFPTALELADQVLQRERDRTRAQVQEQEQRRAIEGAYARQQSTQRQQEELTDANEPLRDASAASWRAVAGGSDVSEDRRGAWLADQQALAPVRRRLAQLEAEVTSLRERQSEHAEVVEEALEVAGVGTWTELRRVVDEAVERLTAQTELRTELRDHERRVLAHTDTLARCEASLSVRAERMEAFEQAAREAGLPAVPPESLDVFLARLDKARDHALAHERLEARLQGAHREREQWLAEVIAVAEVLEQAAPNLAEASGWVAGQVRDAREAGTRQARRRERSERVVELESRVAPTAVRLRRAEEAVTAVLEEVEADNEQAVLDRRALCEAWARQDQALHGAEEAMTAAMGRWAPRWRELLTDHDLDGLDEEQLLASESLARTEADHTHLSEERGALRNQLDALEQVAAVVEAATRVQALEEQDARVLEEMAVLQLATAMLEHTWEAFVQRNQPAVLTRASALLQRCSDGHLVGVRAVEGEIWIEAENGTIRQPHQLSRGAREMLYLVIRFALAMEHAKRVDLPLILDDVLVNQDPERAHGLAQVLREVAAEHQILLLTCRPETRALLQAEIPDTHVLDLPRYAGRGAPVAPRPGPPGVGSEVEASETPLEQVVQHLADVGDRQARADILAATGLSENQWGDILEALRAHPDVQVTGARRGTRYRYQPRSLAAVGAPASSSVHAEG